jgi:hypothetical protein
MVVVEDAPPQVYAVAESVEEGFAANANVMRYPNARGLRVAELLDENVAGLMDALAGFVLLDRSDEDGRLLFTYRHEAFGLTAEQRYVLNDDGYYVVTVTATNTGFLDRAAVARAVLDSFEAA